MNPKDKKKVKPREGVKPKIKRKSWNQMEKNKGRNDKNDDRLLSHQKK